jgi:DNA-binding response OmpR family regulator
MKLLIAEDDVLFRTMLVQVLAPEYEIVVANDGTEAWEIMQQPDAPRLAILDWVMPGLSGPEICRKVRASAFLSSMYILILTSKNSEADIVAGLRAGADDYVTKPPTATELRARTRVGKRILALQEALITQTPHNDSIFLSEKPGSDYAIETPARKKSLRPEILPSLRAHSEPAYAIPDSKSEIVKENGVAVNRLSMFAVENRHGKH